MSLEGTTKVKKALIGNIHLLKKVSGYSAYDLAVADGFKGTLKEWLASLKGDPGYTPQKGTDYNDGEKGDPGTLENHSGIDALNLPVVNVADPTNDTDAVNKKYAEENFASAEKFSVKDISDDFIAMLTDGVTVSTKKVYKQGNVISGYIELRTTFSESAGKRLFTLNSAYKPETITTACGMLTDVETVTPLATGAVIYITPLSGGICLSMPSNHTSEVSAGFSFSYICA